MEEKNLSQKVAATREDLVCLTFASDLREKSWRGKITEDLNTVAVDSG